MTTMKLKIAKLLLFLIFMVSTIFICSILLILLLFMGSLILSNGDYLALLNSHGVQEIFFIAIATIVSMYIAAVVSVKIVFIVIKRSNYMLAFGVRNLIGDVLYELYSNPKIKFINFINRI